MFNIKFKGKYENEEQLIKDKKLIKNAIEFCEEQSITDAFLHGLKFAIPIVIIMITIFCVAIKLANIEIKYSIIHCIIVCCFIMPILTYIHEIIHALTFPIKYEKEIYVKYNEMALFVYCDQPVKKNRFILILLMPTIVLSFVPFIFSIIFIKFLNINIVIDILIISIVMCLTALGDFTNTYNIIKQVPKNAKTFLYGIHSYWVEEIS